MFNIFNKKNKIQILIEQDGIDRATDRFADVISKMLVKKHLAYQFVLEEIEAASHGSDEAIFFANSSGIPKSEFLGAMSNSSPEIDGANGPQQFLLGISSQLNSDINLMVKFRTMIADKIMKNFDLGKYAENGVRLTPGISLASVVKKVENSEHGAFVNINNDLFNFIEDNENCSPEIKMAYAYARRLAAAGMFVQGVVEKAVYDHVVMIFKGLQLTTGHSVEFQESAAKQAFELIESYTDLFDRESLEFMVHMIENGLDPSAIGGEVHDIHKIAFTIKSMKEQFTN